MGHRLFTMLLYCVEHAMYYTHMTHFVITTIGEGQLTNIAFILHTYIWVYLFRCESIKGVRTLRIAALIWRPILCIMTSSNGNIFRVTGLWVGNSPVPGEFPAQRPVTQSFDVFFELCLNKRLSKQSWGGWFETQSRPLWRFRNGAKSHSAGFVFFAVSYYQMLGK